MFAGGLSAGRALARATRLSHPSKDILEEARQGNKPC